MKINTQQGSPVLRSVRWASVAICAALTAFPLLAEEGFIADEHGCKVANPSPKRSETVSWSGKCVEGYADGKGLLQWYVGGVPSTRYEGTLHGGLLSGQGKLTMPNGGTYEGDWLAGKQDGKGVQAMPDGSRYNGEWKEGLPNGHGEMRSASGETLTGEWKEGTFMGTGEQK